MLDFQHKQTAKLRFPTYAMRSFYSEDFVITNIINNRYAMKRRDKR